MSARSVPPEAVRENLLRASLLASAVLPAVFGIPWVLGRWTHRPDLHLHLHVAFSLCEFVSKVPLLIRMPPDWLRGPPNFSAISS